MMCVMVLALGTDSHAQLFQVVSGALERDGSGLTARSGGAVVRLSKGITLNVTAGTKLGRVHKQEPFWLSNEGRTLTHVIVLESGRIEVVCADPTRAVMVRAPLELGSVVQSGRMSVAARADQVSVVNHEGSVLWAAGSWKFVGLPAGKIRTLSSFSNTETSILAGTRVRMQNNLYGGFGRGAELSGVDWLPVAEAAGYRVRIEQLEPERRLVAALETVAPVLSPPPQLPAGRYAMSVQPIDRFGIEGPASPAEAFGVVGVQTSNGGYVDPRGNIVAGYDRRLQLTFASGLIMKGGLFDWQPVPDEIVMPSSEPMNLHVRQAGDTRMLSARVMAHQVRALVSVGPKLVRWPGDNVRIEVSIAGPEGQRAPAWIEPQFRVLLGIDELQVAWTKLDGKFVAEVPAQAGEGPWVVRVEVQDQYGHPLGRDFVEIAPLNAPPKNVPPPLAPVPPPAAQASR